MSHQQKKKREIFLLSKLRTSDYLLFFGGFTLIVLLFLLVPRMMGRFDTLASPFKAPPQLVPARSIQATHNLSLLWAKEEYKVPIGTSKKSLFFATGDRTLVSPMVSLTGKTDVLEAIDIVTGQTQWQTNIPAPILIRNYENKFFVLSKDWLDQAPAKDGQELSYCSFWEKYFSLSVYHESTGQKIWSHGYRGANLTKLYFVDQSVYLEGAHDHGRHGLLIDVDINSGLIVDQQCNGPNPTQPRNNYDILGAAFFIGSIDKQDYGCSPDNRFCFATEGNRLHVLGGSLKQPIAYIDFAGATLAPSYIDVVVQNNIAVIHLDDSDQLFAFRLP